MPHSVGVGGVQVGHENDSLVSSFQSGGVAGALGFLGNQRQTRGGRSTGGGTGGGGRARGGGGGDGGGADIVNRPLPPGLSDEDKEAQFAASQGVATQGARANVANISARFGGDVSSAQFQQAAGRAFTGATAATAAGLSAINIADIRQEQQLELQRRGQILQQFGLSIQQQQVGGGLDIAQQGLDIQQDQFGQNLRFQQQQLQQQGDQFRSQQQLAEQQFTQQGALSTIQLAGKFPGLFGPLGVSGQPGFPQREALESQFLNLGVGTSPTRPSRLQPFSGFASSFTG